LALNVPDTACGFPAIARADARILILGSMPGQASLAAQAYYAHPRNAFWPIMGTLCGFAPDASYSERTDALRAAGVALWDVLAKCIRPGSLDSAIRLETAATNDFPDFFRNHQAIRHVFFNGAAAESLFRRRALPYLAGVQVNFSRLPSTSPAHAGLSFAAKLAAWKAVAATLQQSPGT
jgi:hypoxanthine-DNA glycosylase